MLSRTASSLYWLGRYVERADFIARLVEATVRLGHWLGVPVRAGGSLTDAHVPDAQAGIESALAIERVLRMDVQFVLHAAGILSSFNCFSPEKFVIDDEVLSALRTAQQPIVVDAQTDVAEDAWRQVARRKDAASKRDRLSFRVESRSRSQMSADESLPQLS